ncbi:MAG: hypothetical protein LJE95_09845 [Acidobacteria bacterium]|jgi:tetratricopeptide (TPR) repeat protein|nr:hypothetical protein [Acidobacteriota bacterium]
MVGVLLLALALVPGSAPQAGETWYSHYERGVELVEGGRGAQAVAELAEALRQRPGPGLRIRTYGLRYIDYLPHLYMAMAAHLQGNAERARRELDLCDQAGVAEQSQVGRPLLQAYRLLLRNAEPTARADAPSAATGDSHHRFRLFERRAVVLPRSEFLRLRSQVLHRCGLPSDIQDNHAPWYFHYELGLALVSRGDPQRALDSLIAATEQRPISQRDARMYGMWFTDYRPYFEIALAHAELGNWACVYDALELSSELGEIKEGDEDFARFRQLWNEAATHRQEPAP